MQAFPLTPLLGHMLHTLYTHFPIVLSFQFQGQHSQNMQLLQGGELLKLTNSYSPSHNMTFTHTHTHTLPLSSLKYFKEEVVNHGRSVAGERQRAGGFWVAVVGLVQQAVDVTGQTGRGAHSMVPQDVDHIVQSVQTVLHLRL